MQNQQYRPSPKKFRTRTVSLTSLMMALSRVESQRRTNEQSSNTSGRSRERLAYAHGSATPRPPETERPPQRRGREPALRPVKTSFCWWRDASAIGIHTNISSSKSPLANSPTSCLTCTWKFDLTSGCRHHQTAKYVFQKIHEQAASP